MADTVLMVTTPNTGDDIQAIKAGIMEIADVFAINKSDLDGADKTKMEIEMNLDLNEKKDYRAPVIKVSAIKNEGIDELVKKLEEHRNYLENNNRLEERRTRNNKLQLLKLVENELMEIIVERSVKEDLLDNLSKQITLGTIDPYSAKDKIIELIR